ncbi:hypothetical protein ABI_47240 [Asticcacaulis biprosthecium C19]|uniref:Uncharacterized protein n=1 Tax=Asticcacaulis biprosthecium C19 TaxID=715226 RepID=F4QU76_9CAUL|nr:hypothetical protein ABI_47240 [Asticcacaulis biprosthecium C19]
MVMTLLFKYLRIVLYPFLAGTVLPATAQAADGFLGCWAHQSDTNRVLWTGPFAANESDRQEPDIAAVAARF